MVPEDSLGDQEAHPVAGGRVLEYGRRAFWQRFGGSFMQPLDQAAPFPFLGRTGHGSLPLVPLIPAAPTPFRRRPASFRVVATEQMAIGEIGWPDPSIFNDPEAIPTKSIGILEPSLSARVLSF
jgi:hypothetical protein